MSLLISLMVWWVDIDNVCLDNFNCIWLSWIMLFKFIYFIFFVFVFNCYLLTYFVCWNWQKIAKKQVQYEFDCCCFHFGMNESLFVFMLLSMHLLNFMLWVYVLCFSVWDDYMTRFYYFYDLPTRGSAEILARSSISSESQIKVNFKVTASQ